MDRELRHYGILERSGRYPWGSGENPYQRLQKPFLAYISDLRKEGLSEAQIAKAMGMTTTELRAKNAIARTEQRQADRALILRLKEKGYSNLAITKRTGIPESTVRSLLKPVSEQRDDILNTTAGMLKDELKQKPYLDIGTGTENHLGISKPRLNTAVAMLKEEGYEVHTVKVEQLGTGNYTTVKVLGPPGMDYQDLRNNYDKIGTIASYSDDNGRNFLGLETPKPVSSDRIQVRYSEDGGAAKDGVIEVRPGVQDISLGDSRYAQVRVAVDGTHYLKGMAVYSDDLPDGVDVIFNTNKSKSVPKMDTMKAMKDDPDNPFGSVVRQRHYIDEKGDRQLSAMNVVYEEGDWSTWSKNLPSQMLSKQKPQLAKQQLDISLNTKKSEFEEINQLTNPAIKRKLLETFADNADASAVHLKAAAMPRQSTHVILPVNSLKENEIYARNFRNGENVALVRFPHGGIFEIPELRVNNRNPDAEKLLGHAPDAVAINSKVAERLSGADFDGDTVLVIPNNQGAVRTSSALRGLKDFDPQTHYPGFEGMKRMTEHGTQREMGDVSNLITDMTVKGASQEELAAAVRHSMVVIDAEKHGLNYKQSAKDNGIAALKTKYQGSARSGAATLISRASGQARVPERKPRPASQGGPIDPQTGEKQWVYTGRTYINPQGKEVPVTEKTTQMAITSDARSLSTGTRIESIYASHANELKTLANQARRGAHSTKNTPYSPSARRAYANEVSTLDAKLNTALMNAPLERQAQLTANTVVQSKRRANPDMDNVTLKKVKGQALEAARARVGAKKQLVDITDREWEAIQSAAITNNKLEQILNNADLDKVKELATPRQSRGITAAMEARMRSMIAAGYTQADVADALGVSVSTVNEAV